MHHWRGRKFVADPETGYLNYDALEDHIRLVCRTFDVERVLVDPYNFTRSMLTLADEGIRVEEFPPGRRPHGSRPA